MKPIQLLLLAFVVFALARVIQKYKQRRMRALEFFYWLLGWLGAAFVIMVPDATSFVARLLGIGRGADLIMYASLLIAFYLILRIHLALDRLEQDVTKIVRAMALGRLTEPIEPGSGDRE